MHGAGLCPPACPSHPLRPYSSELGCLCLLPQTDRVFLWPLACPGSFPQRGLEGPGQRVSPWPPEKTADWGLPQEACGPRAQPPGNKALFQGCHGSVRGCGGTLSRAGPARRRGAQLYLEPFELTFNVHFQTGEHGLVLACQVLESAETTATATPSAQSPAPASLAQLPPAQGQGWVRYREENSSKSDRRSQMRRPVRAALDE